MSLAMIAAGAGVGFFTGGPIGAVVGGVTGAMLGSKPAVTEVAPANAAPSSAASADLVNSITDLNAELPNGGVGPGWRPAPLMMPMTPIQPGTASSAAAQADVVNNLIAKPPPTRFTLTMMPPTMSLAGYGEIGGFPMWAIVTGLSVAAYAFYRSR